MTGWLPTPVEELFGADATAEESYDVLTVDVPSASWIEALSTARTTLGCTYFDWLSAVDEPGTGFRVSAHVVALAPVRRLLVRTTVPHASPVLPTAVDVYAGAAWHERETHEMFGVRFEGHPGLDHLLLPENFEGHPLRKDFVLAARVAKAWPGAKEPGESEHGGPKRRQMLPPGVPDPNEWGPLKGQLPPAPTRPTRAAGDRPARAAGERPARAAADRPVRRTRTASQGSASQTSAEATPTPDASGTPAAPTPPTPPTPSAPPRRSRTAAQGSASQTAAEPTPGASNAPAAPASPTPPRRSRTAAQGSASQAAAESTSAPEASPAAPTTPRRARTASGGSASQRTPEADAPGEPPAENRPAARSADAPWHHARPAFEEPKPEAEPTPAEPKPTPEPRPTPEPEPQAEPAATEPVAEPPTSPGTPEGRTPGDGSETPADDADETADDADETPTTPEPPAGGPR
ncbi:dehydrogenase [Streptomyces sp. JV178]|uniref:NADH-quinone oxidoreductase subunit C n=1 Tax=Streptomyces sp. JV178 TaxID=858632 RepID=UPI000C1B1536|nr:NADH-quinone oxidoreductase subunit C [Streptomyces sp. JV178]PIM67583.1 dehydrogenase [Streptomyces sp. JV178]